MVVWGVNANKEGLCSRPGLIGLRPIVSFLTSARNNSIGCQYNIELYRAIVKKDTVKKVIIFVKVDLCCLVLGSHYN